MTTYQDKVEGNNWPWLFGKIIEESKELVAAAEAKNMDQVVYEWLDVMKLMECALVHGSDEFVNDVGSKLYQQLDKHMGVQRERKNEPLVRSDEYVLGLIDDFAGLADDDG